MPRIGMQWPQQPRAEPTCCVRGQASPPPPSSPPRCRSPSWTYAAGTPCPGWRRWCGTPAGRQAGTRAGGKQGRQVGHAPAAPNVPADRRCMHRKQTCTGAQALAWPPPTSAMACGTMPGDSSVPIIVCVLPDDVTPSAHQGSRWGAAHGGGVQRNLPACFLRCTAAGTPGEAGAGPAHDRQRGMPYRPPSQSTGQQPAAVSSNQQCSMAEDRRH